MQKVNKVGNIDYWMEVAKNESEKSYEELQDTYKELYDTAKFRLKERLQKLYAKRS